MIPHDTQTTNPNFALELGSGLNEIIHEHFIVPSWGDLRFDLYVPNPQDGILKVWIKGDDDIEWKELTTPWAYREDSYGTTLTTQQLEGVELREGDYSYNFVFDPSYRFKFKLVQESNDSKSNLLGYANKGFESFSFGGDALEELRGESASLRFTLEGGTEKVVIDDVFFQSQHLNLGNPTAARPTVNTPNNYLVERPQYALSYNEATKTPNWVSWVLDDTWHQPINNNGGGLGRPTIPAQPIRISDEQYEFYKFRFPFEVDYALQPSWRTEVSDYFRTEINGIEYQRGHLSASDDRNRYQKDQLATFLMSNMLPMAKDTNGIENKGGLQYQGAWYGLQRYLSGLAESGKKLYITAGGIGSIGSTTGGINVPEKLWKVAVILESNQSISDINENTDIIAVILPNDASLGTTLDGRQWAKDGTVDGIGRVTLSQVEALLGNIDLLSNLPNSSLKLDLKEQVYQNPYLNSQLKADSNDSQTLGATLIGYNPTIAHNSVLEQSSTLYTKATNSIKKVGFFENSSTSISPIDISSFQIGFSEVATYPSIAKIGTTQVGTSQVGIVKSSTEQNGSSQINSSQIGFAGQTNVNEISLTSSISLNQLLNGNNRSEV